MCVGSAMGRVRRLCVCLFSIYVQCKGSNQTIKTLLVTTLTSPNHFINILGRRPQNLKLAAKTESRPVTQIPSATVVKPGSFKL